MNKEIIKQRFQKAVSSYHDEAAAQQEIAGRLFRILSLYEPARGGSLLEIGCGTGFLTERLISELSPREAWLNDICPEVEPVIAPYLSPSVHFLPGDAESVCYPESGFDLIASSSTIQWFENPGEFLHKMARRLKPNGRIAISSFGPENMKEIKQVTGQGLNYPDIRSIVATAFHILDYRQETITLRFGSPKAVLQHLKRTGVTGNNRQIWTPGDLREFENRYRMAFGDESGIPLTYQPEYIIATTKTEQQ